MARIRTIKPSFFTSTTTTALAKTARLTFIGLWTQADDEGRTVDDARLVKAAIWPLDDDMTAKRVEADLAELAAAGLTERYEHAGKRYLRIVGWAEHQKINRPQKSTLPASPTECAGHENTGSAPDAITADSVNAHGADTERSRPERKGKEGEEEGNRNRSSSSSSANGASPAKAEEEIIEPWAMDLALDRFATRISPSPVKSPRRWLRAVALEIQAEAQPETSATAPQRPILDTARAHGRNLRQLDDHDAARGELEATYAAEPLALAVALEELEAAPLTQGR